MIEMHSSKALRLNLGINGNNTFKVAYVFLTKEIDLGSVDWIAYSRVLGTSYPGAGNKDTLGSFIRFLGITEEDIWGTYVPSVDATHELSADRQARQVTHRAASSLVTFTSKLDAAPVQCLILMPAALYIGGTAVMPNNASAAQLYTLSTLLYSTSLATASVGLKDSDAEVILLADEFKKGSEYRISDMSIRIPYRDE